MTAPAPAPSSTPFAPCAPPRPAREGHRRRRGRHQHSARRLAHRERGQRRGGKALRTRLAHPSRDRSPRDRRGAQRSRRDGRSAARRSRRDGDSRGMALGARFVCRRHRRRRLEREHVRPRRQHERWIGVVHNDHGARGRVLTAHPQRCATRRPTRGHGPGWAAPEPRSSVCRVASRPAHFESAWRTHRRGSTRRDGSPTEAPLPAIDISDGLVADLRQLSAASAARIELDATRVPCFPDVSAGDSTVERGRSMS